MRVVRLSKGGVLLIGALCACAGPLERGERLYRQGDVRGALDVWNEVDATSRHYARVQPRRRVVEAEFESMLRRYEKRAEFFENEGRLAEAVLYYRLAFSMNPERGAPLDRVQLLVREQANREREEREGLATALAAGDLKRASDHAATLEALNPFDPAIQIEIRQVRAATGGRVLSYITEGEAAYAAGEREAARQAFQAILDLDPRNEAALGYLSYIGQFEELEARREVPPPPRSISQEEILAEGHFRSAVEAERAGESFSAIGEYEAALTVNPEHAGARRALAGLRSRLRPQIQQLYELGKHYFQEEDLHNAIRAWRRALSIDPTHQRTRENVERAERMLARLEEIQTGGS